MEELIRFLDKWKNQPSCNTIFEKDYYIDEVKERVHLMIAISVEKAFLFKTFTAVCPTNMHDIEKAIEKLENKKDELI